MGYTTKFTGCINLSRALTLKEAKELLEIADLDRAEVREITNIDAQPRLMCAACEKQEVGTYEPVCPECRKSLEQAGILKPQDQRQQIGPLDV